ncbi:Hemerythrin-like metal-binding protein [Elusimicrobium minutum Pei191]|uniref:Hemerythrin-like metal-binding protein n=1 Tax=Elusimicrobium minutum (strain Pei191) TaxID=445932 RepID=B2KDK8_ELUMP|nr:hemerythrin family protein [Elusimicrobium minutum]ACC98604.1 Hemerythrin-like metal-binding protein [Elusimicrobium minutum Pei191]
MVYAWDKNLETGNEIIDRQHKQLFEMLNNLIIAHQEARGPVELDAALKFMTEYTVRHFEDEEALQIKYRYPNYEEHKNQHNHFKFVIKDLVQQLVEEGYSKHMVEKTIRIIASWLITHIKGDDLELAKHIRKIDLQE